MSKKLVGICMIFILITFGQLFAQSDSYLDTIYTAKENGRGTLNGVVRILEGKSNRRANVETITPKIASQTTSFHKVQPKTTYDPTAEIKLMNEIFNMLNSSTIDFTKAKAAANARRIQDNKRTGILTGVPTTVIRVPVKSTSTKTLAEAKALAEEQAKIAAKEKADAEFALLQQKIKAAKEMIQRLLAMGIVIEGGIIGEGSGLWSLEQLEHLYTCLRTLPMSFVRSTKQFRRVVDYAGRKTVLGYVFAGIPRVYICNYGVRPIRFEETIVHEMAHTWMFDKVNAKAKSDFEKTFWPGNKRPVAGTEQPTSVYGGTNVFEDFAEAVREFWQNCVTMRKTHPKRWEFIRTRVFGGQSWNNRRTIGSAGSTTLSPIRH